MIDGDGFEEGSTIAFGTERRCKGSHAGVLYHRREISGQEVRESEDDRFVFLISSGVGFSAYDIICVPEVVLQTL